MKKWTLHTDIDEEKDRPVYKLRYWFSKTPAAAITLKFHYVTKTTTGNNIILYRIEDGHHILISILNTAALPRYIRNMLETMATKGPDREICAECGRSVAPGSRRWVNRVLIMDNYEERKAMGFKYPEGGWICEECETKLNESYHKEDDQ